MGSDTLTRAEAIRLYCFDCSGFSYYEVDKCPLTDCPLFRFRNRKASSQRMKEIKGEDPTMVRYPVDTLSNHRNS